MLFTALYLLALIRKNCSEVIDKIIIIIIVNEKSISLSRKLEFSRAYLSYYHLSNKIPARGTQLHKLKKNL